MGDLLKGMTVLAYSEDPVAAAKVVEAFAKTTRSSLSLAGAMGATALDQAGVKAVASMPSREELIASDRGVHRCPGIAARRGHRRACGEHRGHPDDASRSGKRPESI